MAIAEVTAVLTAFALSLEAVAVVIAAFTSSIGSAVTLYELIKTAIKRPSLIGFVYFFMTLSL